jgi:hypothetical protein
MALFDTLQELYGITFTDRERMLLTTGNDLLTVLDQQSKYVLARAVEPIPCPGCGVLTCRRAACTLPWDDTTAIPDDAYACRFPSCGAKLIWHLGLIGGDQWFTLAPGQTVTITAPAAERGPCICEGREGHNNVLCPWFGTDTDGPAGGYSGAI